jgi:hypothetical protein
MKWYDIVQDDTAATISRLPRYDVRLTAGISARNDSKADFLNRFNGWTIHGTEQVALSKQAIAVIIDRLSATNFC